MVFIVVCGGWFCLYDCGHERAFNAKVIIKPNAGHVRKSLRAVCASRDENG